MDRPLSFASLPNEIVTQICEHPDLNKEDLITLRLTSKAHGIYDASTKALSRYFADITVLFTRHSFQTLVNICERPVSSVSIRSIMLSSIRCRDDMNHRDVINALLTEREDFEEDLDSEDDYRESDSDEDRVDQLYALHDISVKMHSYVSRARGEVEFSERACVKLFVQALRSLARLDTPVVLGLTNEEYRGLGCSKCFCAEDAKDEDLWQNLFLDTANIIATALFKSKLLISEFNVETCRNLKCRSIRLRRLLDRQDMETKTVFSRLEALRFKLDSFADRYDHAILLPFSAMFTQSTHLKSLRLESGKPPHPDDDNLRVEPLFLSISSPCLEELCLNKLEVTEAGMRAFEQDKQTEETKHSSMPHARNLMDANHHSHQESPCWTGRSAASPSCALQTANW